MAKESFFTVVESFPLSGLTPGDAPFSPHSLLHAPNGLLYLSDEFNHRIVMMEITGKVVGSFGKRGSGRGEFWYPRGLDVTDTAQGPTLAVCDSWNHRILLFDLDGNPRGNFGGIGDGDDDFNEPCALFGGPGGITVVDRGNHRIKQHAVTGEMEAAWGRRANRSISSDVTDTNKCSFFYPMAAITFPGERMVIADTGNRLLVVTDNNGKELDRILLDVEGHPPYRYPERLFWLGEERVMVIMADRSALVFDLSCKWSEVSVNLDTARLGSVFALLPGLDAQRELYGFNAEGNALLRLRITPESLRSLQAHTVQSVQNAGRNDIRAARRFSLYLASDEGKSIEEGDIVSFIKNCAKQALSLANSLGETEKRLAEIIGVRTEIEEKRKTDPDGENYSEDRAVIYATTENTVNWRAQWRIHSVTWNEMLEWLENGVTALARIPESGAKQAFEDYISSRLKTRKEGYKRALDRLRTLLATPQNVDLAAVSSAFSTLLLCEMEEEIWNNLTSQQKKAGVIRETRLKALLAEPAITLENIHLSLMSLIVAQAVEWEFCETAITAQRIIVDLVTPKKRLSAFLKLHNLAEMAGANHDETVSLLEIMRRESSTWDEKVELANRLFWCGKIAEGEEVYNACESEIPEEEEEVRRRWIIQKKMMEKESLPPLVAGKGQNIPFGDSVIQYKGSLVAQHPVTSEFVSPFMVSSLADGAMLIGSVEGEILRMGADGVTTLLLSDPGRMAAGMAPFDNDRLLLLTMEKTPPFGSHRFYLIDKRGGECQEATSRFDFLREMAPQRLTVMSDGSILALGRGESAKRYKVHCIMPGGEDGGEVGELPVTGRIGMGAVHGDRLFVSDFLDNRVYQDIPLEKGRHGSEESFYAPLGLEFCPDGSFFVSCALSFGLYGHTSEGERSVRIVGVLEEGRLFSFPQTHLYVNPDLEGGAEIALSDWYNRRIHLFRVSTGKSG